MRSQGLTKKERRFFSVAIALVFSTLTTTVSYAAPFAERPIDVVAVNWPGSRAATVTVDQVEQSIKEYVAPNWRSFTTSQGGTTTTAINFVPGIISLEPISLTRPMPCEGSSSVSFMTLVQREFYRSQKISNYDNRYLIILSPEAGCAWQGKAPLGSPTSDGGVLTLHNTASGFVITHELGHTFGLVIPIFSIVLMAHEMEIGAISARHWSTEGRLMSWEMWRPPLRCRPIINGGWDLLTAPISINRGSLKIST